MPANIHAKELPLREIFSPHFSFKIPSYQRPYAWKTEQAGELLSDVLSVLDKDSSPPLEASPYFLGSIVLIKKDDLPAADVVDGQQRLTTLTILLSTLREVVSDNFKDSVTNFLYQKSDPITGAPPRYRLKLRQRDEEFFRTRIQDKGALHTLNTLDKAVLPDSQRNIRDNALFLWDKLKALPQSDCERLLMYLMNRCYLVTVTTPDFDSAYRIFSVLNTRGMQLSLTDLLKSEITGAIPETERDKYTEIWEETEEDVGREAFQELFSHIRMIRRRVKASETTLKEFQTLIKPSPTAEPREFINDTLKPYAAAFSDIKNESFVSTIGADKVNAHFKWLNQIDNFDWLPPAIEFLSSNRSDPARLASFFADLERLAAGLMVRRANVTGRLERYGRLLTEMKNGDDLFRPDSPLQLTSSEQASIVAALDGNLYEEPFARYVLLRLDSDLSSGGASYNHKIVSIEHVLPQNPPQNSEWEIWFPSPSDRNTWVHRVGNLLLLSRRKNSQARNYDFDKKKTLYFQTDSGISPFQLTTQVIGQNSWDIPTVQNRQNQLLDRLKTIWRLS